MATYGAKRSLNVIAGPALSGKTSEIIRIYAEAVGSGGTAIAIVPGGRDRRALRRRILETTGSLEGESVLTFVALAEKILDDAEIPAQPIPVYEQELLIRSITTSLAEANKLSFFGPALETPGFHHELLRLIKELKAWQIEPERFARFPTAGSARDAEIAEIYRAYQAALKKRDLYDAEGRFWRARLTLEDKCLKRCPLQPLPAVLLVDGFTDFTPNESSLLAALARWVERVCVTLPYEEGGARGELFEKAGAALKRLERDFEIDPQFIFAPKADSVQAVIAAGLFSDTPAAKADARGNLVVISTSGAAMEMREVAREAKKLILAGVSPIEIAVVTRSPSTYSFAARDAFDELGVPLDLGRPSDRSGVLKVVTAIGEIIAGDFARGDVAALMACPYVDLTALAGGSLTLLEFSLATREAGVLRSKGQWRSRLEALERRLTSAGKEARQRNDDDDAPDAMEVTAVSAALTLAAFEKLANLLNGLSHQAPVAKHADALAAALDGLGVRERVLVPAVGEEVLFRDLAAFVALDEALLELAACEVGMGAAEGEGEGEGEGEAPVALSFGRFVEFLWTTLAANGISDGTIGRGGVSFLDASEARNLSYKVVFFCGLTADAFPARLPVGPFYTRSERRKLSGHGLGARDERLHLSGERLLFYQGATRAREKLYLTFPATNEEGKAQLESFYLAELVDLFELSPDAKRRLGPSRKIAPIDEVASPREVALAEALALGQAEEASECIRTASRAAVVYPAFSHALGAAAIEAHRNSLAPLGPYDAVLSPPAASAVAGRFAPGAPWSASRLNDYVVCPYLFFTRRVLSVERPEEPTGVLSPRERGALFHEILARAFTRWRDEGLTKCLASDEARKRAREITRDVFRKVTAAWAGARGCGGEVPWRADVLCLGAILSEFVEFEIDRIVTGGDGSGIVPELFEYSFGMAPEEDGVVDEASLQRAVEISRDGATERIRGRIDRIDRLASRNALAVVDYKLSRIPSARTVNALEDLQMPLYLWAARELLSEGEATALGATYLSIRKCKAGEVLKFTDEAGRDEFLTRFEKRLFEVADSVRSGVFSPAPTGKCPQHCEARGVCRFNLARIEHLRGQDGHS